MNRELEKIIAYLSSRGPGLKLQAIAMPVYIRDGLEILAPRYMDNSISLMLSTLPELPI